MRILYVVTDLIAPLVVGYFLHQRGIISGGLVNKLIGFNVVCVYTVLSLLSIWVLPITRELLWIPFFGLLFVITPGIIAEFTFARRHKNPLNRGAYIMSAMLSNIGTLGGVCAFILYNEHGFAYSQLIGTCQNILLVLVCFPLAQRYHAQYKAMAEHNNARPSFREMFFSKNQISLLGMSAGFLLNVNDVARPEFLSPVFQCLVHVGAWTALLPVGFLIDFKRANVYYRQVLDLVPLRFVIMPAFIWFASRLVFSDPILLNTFLILSMAPTAINAVIAARLYHLNVNMAVSSFLMTTTIFLLVIFPALFFVLR